MKNKVEKTSHCLNCERPLQDEKYCPDCGQLNNVKTPYLGDFIRESLSNFFALDGKFFKSLSVLFSKPGHLPSRFIGGKRVSYMHPVRMYFFSSIILLFIINLQNRDDKIINTGKEDLQALGDSTIQAEILEIKGMLQQEESEISFSKRFEAMYLYANVNPTETTDRALEFLRIDSNWWNTFIYEQAHKAANFDDNAFSEFFFSKLFWILFLFLPFFALILKLIYIRRGYFYLEHLFFAFYTQSAFFLMLFAGLLLRFWLEETPLLIVVASFSIYLLLSLHNFYNQSWPKTILKFMLLNTAFTFLFFVFLLASIILSFIFY